MAEHFPPLLIIKAGSLQDGREYVLRVEASAVEIGGSYLHEAHVQKLRAEDASMLEATTLALGQAIRERSVAEEEIARLLRENNILAAKLQDLQSGMVWTPSKAIKPQSSAEDLSAKGDQ